MDEADILWQLPVDLYVAAYNENFGPDQDEIGHTLPGFENGVGLDNLNIRFQDKQGI
jgi:hypothetical protein